MPLTAGAIQLPPDLESTFSGIGGNAYNQIGANYNAARTKANNDALVRGMPGIGSYPTERFGTQEGLDIGNLEVGLGGGYGETAYKNKLAQRDYEQQRQLASEFGSAMAPSTLQQVLAGFGGGANAAMEMAPFMSGMIPKNSSPMAINPSGVSSTGMGAQGYDPELGYYYQ